MRATYITRAATASFVSIFNEDEGGQQEEICVWLTDVLKIGGCIKRPHIHGAVKRELSDILLSYEFGTFLIELKTLAVLTRKDLPSRRKLSDDVENCVKKASRQLAGGLRWLKLGYRVTDSKDTEIEVEIENPAHAIILVPDLELLSDAKNLGGKFLRRFYEKTGAVLHILDTTELLRTVQVSQMVARDSKKLSEIMVFDWYLMERFKRTVKLETPAFEMIFRYAKEGEAVNLNDC